MEDTGSPALSLYSFIAKPEARLVASMSISLELWVHVTILSCLCEFYGTELGSLGLHSRFYYTLSHHPALHEPIITKTKEIS